MILYHVMFLGWQNHVILAQSFTTESDALNYIHDKDRVHPVDAYIIIEGRAVRK